MNRSTSVTPPSPQLQRLDKIYQNLLQEFESKNKKLVAWMKSRDIKIEDFRETTQQVLAAISLAGTVAMNQPVDSMIGSKIQAIEKTKDEDLLDAVSEEEHQAIIQKMESIVIMPPGHMDKETELYLEQQLTDMLGFEVTAELDGHRLNHSVGIMGGEQHLRRFPTDTLAQHDQYQEAGIAPNRGAFGWFTEDAQLTERSIKREEYYLAVQTLYLPDWNSNYKELKPWYKFRKMIVINPAEKLAVVAVVGDAGPAKWVQKQSGGSPEVIREGKIWSKKSRGRVILFFVDDPEDKVPLGPISLEYASDLVGEAA